MSDEISHVFSVRGQPVGFQPGSYGGSLVAVARGYFPISATGYRSLAGHFGFNGPTDPSTIPPEFLESLAAAQDADRRTLLTRLRRPPRLTTDRLSNFIGVCLDAEKAVDDGFFAPETERVTLWRAAYQLLCVIHADRRFQPSPSAPAWTAEHCAASLEASRDLLRFVHELASGGLRTEPLRERATARAYFALPERSTGEPAFNLPVITPEFCLDLPSSTSEAEEDKLAPEAITAMPTESVADDPRQMTLLEID